MNLREASRLVPGQTVRVGEGDHGVVKDTESLPCHIVLVSLEDGREFLHTEVDLY